MSLGSNVLAEVKTLINLYEKMGDETAFLRKMDSLVEDDIISEDAGNAMLTIIGFKGVRQIKTTTTKRSASKRIVVSDPCTGSGGSVGGRC